MDMLLGYPEGPGFCNKKTKRGIWNGGLVKYCRFSTCIFISVGLLMLFLCLQFDSLQLLKLSCDS